ncbi:MAG: hypothetical protein WAN74_05895 [Thermoplasmata archaeon]
MMNWEDRQLGVVSWVAGSIDDEATIRLNLETLEEGTASFLQQVNEAIARRGR